MTVSCLLSLSRVLDFSLQKQVMDFPFHFIVFVSLLYPGFLNTDRPCLTLCLVPVLCLVSHLSLLLACYVDNIFPLLVCFPALPNPTISLITFKIAPSPFYAMNLKSSGLSPLLSFSIVLLLVSRILCFLKHFLVVSILSNFFVS